jgi:hypothetical protein
VQLVKMQRIMKHDGYAVISSGECMDLFFSFKMRRKAKSLTRPKEVQHQAAKVLHSVRN